MGQQPLRGSQICPAMCAGPGSLPAPVNDGQYPRICTPYWIGQNLTILDQVPQDSIKPIFGHL